MPPASGVEVKPDLPVLPPPVPPPADSSLDEEFARLLADIREQRPDEDLSLVEKAWKFARKAHEGQLRDSGQPYILHPLAVARILCEMRMDVIAIVAGLLHDTREDNKHVTAADIQANFGDDVARCVDGVTKLRKIKLQSAEDQQTENYRKMLLAMATDIRVIIVKLADRLHNMRTLGALSPERRERIAKETLEIYAPIAHRLGMGKVRGELEDLSFKYLEPEAAAELQATIETQRAENEAYLEKLRQTVEADLRREGIPARVEARMKRAYSVNLKLKRQKISIDQVYDLLGLRIITDSMKNCYGALGVIHSQWHPVPGRIKDFIAMPRPNLYQSLHTSVVGPEGKHFEIQIRTEEMHRVAEEGIAAHWKYKEGRKGMQDDQRIAWLRQLVEWQREMRKPEEFQSTLALELVPDEVYCFTPKGRVIVLPVGATPIDFAYAVHSEVGKTCTGAKVNGRIVPLKYELQNGEVVDILTQAGHKPSKDWLAIVRTPRARNKIKHLISEDERERSIEIGRKYLEKEARRMGIHLNRLKEEDLARVASEYGCGKIEDLYSALGFGRYSPRQVLQNAAPEETAAAAPVTPEPPGPQPQHGAGGGDETAIRVHGVGDVMTYRANCCNPIRGDAIVGYVTRGKGIAVHSRQCKNVQALLFDSERRMDVEWARNIDETFAVRLIAHTDDRPGLLYQLVAILAGEHANVRSLEAKTDFGSTSDAALIEMTIDVRDKKQLDKLCSSMRRVPGVRDIERTLHQ